MREAFESKGFYKRHLPPLYKIGKDGVDHINVANTNTNAINSLISSRASLYIRHHVLGNFHNFMGFESYISSPYRDDALRTAGPSLVSRITSKTKSVRLANHNAIMVDSILRFVLANEELRKAIYDNELPFDYYTINSERVPMRNNFSESWISYMNEVSKAVKELKSPEDLIPEGVDLYADFRMELPEVHKPVVKAVTKKPKKTPVKKKASTKPPKRENVTVEGFDPIDLSLKEDIPTLYKTVRVDLGAAEGLENVFPFLLNLDSADWLPVMSQMLNNVPEFDKEHPRSMMLGTSYVIPYLYTVSAGSFTAEVEGVETPSKDVQIVFNLTFAGIYTETTLKAIVLKSVEIPTARTVEEGGRMLASTNVREYVLRSISKTPSAEYIDAKYKYHLDFLPEVYTLESAMFNMGKTKGTTVVGKYPFLHFQRPNVEGEVTDGKVLYPQRLTLTTGDVIHTLFIVKDNKAVFALSDGKSYQMFIPMLNIGDNHYVQSYRTGSRSDRNEPFLNVPLGRPTYRHYTMARALYAVLMLAQGLNVTSKSYKAGLMTNATCTNIIKEISTDVDTACGYEDKESREIWEDLHSTASLTGDDENDEVVDLLTTPMFFYNNDVDYAFVKRVNEIVSPIGEWFGVEHAVFVSAGRVGKRMPENLILPRPDSTTVSSEHDSPPKAWDGDMSDWNTADVIKAIEDLKVQHKDRKLDNDESSNSDNSTDSSSSSSSDSD